MEPLTLIMLVGLPRSGKSTVARQLTLQYGHPIVNPDAIRLALHGQAYIASAEDFVWATAKLMVRSLFKAGHRQVVLDATNTTRKRRDEWKKDEEWSREFIVLDTPADVCEQRAEKGGRFDLLPVIERMARDYEDIGPDEGPVTHVSNDES